VLSPTEPVSSCWATANLTPGTPYGGVRASGLGREHGREGLESFLETRSYVLPGELAHQLEDQGVPVR
jgi:hypothetical protein